MSQPAFNPRAMIMARRALELTQTALAERAGVTQGAISHWEKGIRTPGDAIGELASALEVLPKTLLDSEVSTTTPMFRAAATRSKKAARKVESRIELARLAAARILEEVELSPALDWPTEDDPLPSDPDAAAAQLRVVWRIPPGPILDLAGYIEAAGGVVIKSRFGSDKVDAAFAHPRRDAIRWMLLNVETPDPARARLTLAHELGHAILHHYDAFNVPNEEEREAQAYRFALALLVPADEFVRDVAVHGCLWSDFLVLRQKWGVSAAALSRRARDLALVSNHRYAGLSIDRRQAGHWYEEPGEVETETPTTFAETVAVLRSDGQFNDADFEATTGLPYSRLTDLLPEQFPATTPPRAGLRIVR